LPVSRATLVLLHDPHDLWCQPPCQLLLGKRRPPLERRRALL